MQLPREIRDQILGLVVGDNLIYVQQCRLRPYGRYGPRQPNDFCHLVRSDPEAKLRPSPRSGFVDEATEDPEFWSDGCDKKSLAPRCCGGQWTKHAKAILQMDLRVLRVCQQLYEESSAALWRTNTFSFDEPHVFNAFMTSLTPDQKRKMRYLEIRAAVDPADQYSNNGFGPYASDWNLEDRKSEVFKCVQGVKKLYFHVSRDDGSIYYEEEPADKTSEERLQIYRTLMASFGALRALHLDEVVFTVNDSQLEEEASAYDGELVQEILTAAEKKQLVAEITGSLL